LLPLAVLRSLTRLLEAVLLTFLLARIARQEACLLQCRTVVTIDLGERTCDRHLQCTSLTAGAATIQSADNVERILLLRSHQRVADQLLMQLVGEVVLNTLPVESERPVPRSQADPRGRLLAAADRLCGATRGARGPRCGRGLTARERVGVLGRENRLGLGAGHSRFPSLLTGNLRDLGDFVGRRLLRGMRMVRARVDLELLGLRTAELVLRQHALHDLLHKTLRPIVQLLAERLLTQTTRVAGVPVGELLLTLVPGQTDLVGVHDDDEVAS